MAKWSVPRMWQGGEVWILGGGPSLPRQFNVPEDVIASVQAQQAEPSAYTPYMKAIHNKHVIAINMAFKFGDWMDIVFFGDKKFYLPAQKDLAKHKALKVSCHSFFEKHPKIKYLKRDNAKPKGISTRDGYVSWNANSGAAAISLAVQLGAKRIILVGFDMKLDDKDKHHWHTLYKVKGNRPTKRSLPFDNHLSGFEQIEKDAKKLGVEIINASPESAIKEFTKTTVDEQVCMSI